MALTERRLAENAPGPLFVDESCIDCATCREVAPAIFARSTRGLSFVSRQPATPDEERRAGMALVSCPTASIGASPRLELGPAVASLPEEIEGGVFYCGYSSEKTYGGSSYFIRRPGGNVLVDSPRASAPLLRRLSEWGGVRLHFLSHIDDVGDHEGIHRRFGTERILHADDARGLRLERLVSGRDDVDLAEDLKVIPIPGHTRGSMALLYRSRYLFTGDHLWGSEDSRRLGASREVCWYSWDEQLRSLQKLLDYSFEWVLPGHGRRIHLAPDEMARQLRRLVEEGQARRSR